jgi:membrane protease YdiL (CAAX protease family)
MFNLRIRSIWLRVLSCFALVVLSCGIKNYLIVIVNGTVLCPYLCTSVFGVDTFFSLPLLGQLFEVQIWVLENLQSTIDMILIDRWKIATGLMFAPVFEELIYRGPLFLSRKFLNNTLWWFIGIGLTLVFALGHGRNGLALVPLITLGICCLWLIWTTQRFWPSIALHFLYNFFFLSILIYQSLSVSD